MNIMFFCANPVNGGTAKIFFEIAKSFKKNTNHTIYAAIDRNNPVEIYKRMDGLDRLNIYSEHEVCDGLYGGNIAQRLIYRILRRLKYHNVRRSNIREIEKYLRQNHIECVVIHNGGYAGDELCDQVLIAAHACRELVIGRVLVFHNDFKKNILRKLQFMYYDWIICRDSTDIITVSNFTRDRLLRCSFINKDITVIYNGITENKNIDSDLESKLLNKMDRKFKILVLGNFHESKGQIYAIETINILKRQGVDAKYIFIGNIYDSLYYEECSNRIMKYSLSSDIDILHGINDASAYIGLFDLMIVPSMFDESFGIISVEAMAKGVPVIVFDCGGLSEVVKNGRDGYVVPRGDFQLMAKKVYDLLKETQTREIMGCNGRRDYIEKFTVGKMFNKYNEIIEKYNKS